MKDYKKILEGVVDIINTAEKSDIGFANICTYIGENCPELKEPDDERIIKALRERIIRYDPNNEILIKEEGISQRQFIAWLEKQGEQKPADNQFTPEQAGVLDKHIDKFLEQKHAKLDEKLWAHDDNIFLDAAKMMVEDSPRKNYGWINKGDIVPWFYSLKERLESLKDRVQPKQEWSEEDELMLTSIIQTLKLTNGAAQMKIDWLKSLRPQNRWKPSDEQINALDDVISSRDIKYDVLSELWKDLKKLRNE